MNSKTTVVAVILIVSVGCNRSQLSPEFKEKSGQVYRMIEAAQDGKVVPLSDYKAAISAAEKLIKTDIERHAFETLTTYEYSWRYAYGFPEEKRVIDICHEAARQVFDSNGSFAPVSDLSPDALKKADSYKCISENGRLIGLKFTTEWKSRMEIADKEASRQPAGKHANLLENTPMH